MAYTIGGISGCHINPAITLGCLLTKRISGKDAAMYMIFQVIGAFIGSALLYALVSTSPDLAQGTTTGANACAAGTTNGLIVEIVLTCIFVLVVLGTTDAKKGAGNFAGLAIGLSLILIHLVGIHYTGTSVNPARSIAPAVFQGGQALSDLWVFIVGPFVGAALAACIWCCIGCDCEKCEK
jgi:aquaporin Z